jgi:tetratricopeptide (TPR) repeat protein
MPKTVPAAIQIILATVNFTCASINLRVASQTMRVIGHSLREAVPALASRQAVIAGLAICIALMAAGRGMAQQSPSNAALSPEAGVIKREGNAAIYNMDYAGARARFEELRKLAPRHPAGDLYLAVVVWLEQLNKSRRLVTSLYRDDSSFFTGVEKAKESSEGDAVDPTVDRAFRQYIAQAKIKAMALVNQDRNNPDALYYLGTVYGVIAGYDASITRKFFSAVRNGSRSVDLHQKVIKINPNYYDAYLSLGIYNYIVATLPFPLKALAAMSGFHGNKERGMSQLKLTIEKESDAADDARVILLAIYQNEKQYGQALEILQTLSAKYPGSYLLKLETASTLAALGHQAEAAKIFEGLLTDGSAHDAGDLVHFQYAEALAAEQDYNRAAEHFLIVPKLARKDSDLATTAMLRAAQVYDLAGKRRDALTYYQAVLARPNSLDSREKAESGIKQAYRHGTAKSAN